MAKKKSKKKTKRRIKNKKIFPLNLKSLGNQIKDYPFVEIEWLDIEGDAGWGNTKDLNKEKVLPEYLVIILCLKIIPRLKLLAALL